MNWRVECMPLMLEHNVRRWMRRVARRVYPPTYVLGRVACLGQEVFKRLPGRMVAGGGRTIATRRCALMNMQKVRCDVLLEWVHAADRAALRTQAARVVPHLARQDVA